MPDIAEERAESEQARLLPNASNVTEGNAGNVSKANPPQRPIPHNIPENRGLIGVISK